MGYYGVFVRNSALILTNISDWALIRRQALNRQSTVFENTNETFLAIIQTPCECVFFAAEKFLLS